VAPRLKKRLFDAVRIMICVAALWWVARGVALQDSLILRGGVELIGRVTQDGDRFQIQTRDGATVSVGREDIATDPRGEPRISWGVRTAWRNSTKWLLLLAVAVHLPVGFLQGVRIRWLLRAQSIALGYWDCVKLSFAGNFLNFAAPLGSNAGDIFKAYFVSLHTSHKTEAVTTVALDRLIGLGTLLVVVAIITALSPKESRLAEFGPYLLTLLGVGGVAASVYLSASLRRRLPPPAWLRRLPMFTHLQRMDHAARALANRKRIVIASVLVTVLLQTLAIGAYFIIAIALGLTANAGNVLEYYAYFYTGAVVQALPGPPQGLGTVELAYSYFFASFGSPSQIICMALAARLVVLVCALPGAYVTLSGTYKPAAAAFPVVGPADTPQPADPKRDLAAT